MSKSSSASLGDGNEELRDEELRDEELRDEELRDEELRVRTRLAGLGMQLKLHSSWRTWWHITSALSGFCLFFPCADIQIDHFLPASMAL